MGNKFVVLEVVEEEEEIDDQLELVSTQPSHNRPATGNKGVTQK